MPALFEYSNVYNTALLMLRERGYQLWYNKDGLFGAEKDGWDFFSDSPCGLLGLVTIFESTKPPEFQEYWWRREGEELYGHLPDEPPRPYEPVYRRVKKDEGEDGA